MPRLPGQKTIVLELFVDLFLQTDGTTTYTFVEVDRPELEELGPYIESMYLLTVTHNRTTAHQWTVALVGSNTGRTWSTPTALATDIAANGETPTALYKFFLLYPYGFALGDDEGGPVRSWNHGMSSESDRDDVGFIKVAIAAADDFLRKQVVSEGKFSFVPASAFDANRKFLFGYSAGGTMAYRLVSEMANGDWAALWVMESSYGGTAHFGFTTQFPVVEHVPPPGAFAISLFAHHGEADTVVPPGPRTQHLGTVRSDFAVRALQGILDPAEGNNDDPIKAGRLNEADAKDLAPAFRTLAGAFHAYKDANFETEQELFENGPDILGGFTSVLQSAPGTGPLELNNVNPLVARYIDPQLDHTGYWDAGNLHYFTARTVWDFFKAHPRTFV